MGFAVAQTFYLDPAQVDNASEVGISSIDLYFRSKPDPIRNRSGIQYPGVTVQLVPTYDGVPVLLNAAQAPFSRLGWTNVLTSAGAAVPTTFRFTQPVQCATGSEYAMVVAYDGDEDFRLWYDREGWFMVGTTTPSTGPSGPGAGRYYTYVSSVPYATGTPGITANSSIVTTVTQGLGGVANTDYLVTSWNRNAGDSLKFNVKVARYSFAGDVALASHLDPTLGPASAQVMGGGITITNDPATGQVEFLLPSQRYEYVTYDRYSSNTALVLAGELCYQNTVFYPGGTAAPATVALANGSNLVTGTGVNWNTLLNLGGPDPEYLVFTGRNQRGANADSVAVRRVASIVSNTVITVDSALPFTNAVANFFRSPVAVVDQTRRARIFGSTTDLLILRGSTANSTMRFVNNSVTAVAVANAGVGYSNTDHVTITGFESVSGKVLGGYSATANLATNGNGAVTAIYLGNVGAGFSNASAITAAVANTTNGASSGSGLTLTYTTGSLVRTEFVGDNSSGGYFANCVLVDVEPGDVMPGLIVNNPAGTFYEAAHRLSYYSLPDVNVISGRVTYCDADSGADSYSITPFTVHHTWDLARDRVLPSWSNEFYSPYANGAACGALGGSTSGGAMPGTSNSSVVVVETISNNDFVALKVVPSVTTLTMSRYIVNGDDAGEDAPLGGNAWARGLELPLRFSNGAAEDVLVWTTAYWPSEANLHVYCRVLNTQSDQADIKDVVWTQLVVDPNLATKRSDPTNASDMIEFSWTLPPYPDTIVALTGSVSASNGSAVLTGVGTSWSTNAAANVVPGALVKLYSPLFPDTYMVSPVASVANDTSLTLQDPVSNVGLVGAGLKLDSVYQHTAFHNVLNENVIRYYDALMVPHDTYDAYQVKVVMLSLDGRTVPLVDDVRIVGASA